VKASSCRPEFRCSSSTLGTILTDKAHEIVEPYQGFNPAVQLRTTVIGDEVVSSGSVLMLSGAIRRSRSHTDTDARRDALSVWLMEFSVLWAVFPVLNQLVENRPMDLRITSWSVGITLTSLALGLILRRGAKP
jgi:hypothetical protein